MKRNRKKQSASIQWGPAIKIVLLCMIIGLFGIGYVDQKNQLYMLSSEYRKLEQALARMKRENAERSRILDSLQSLTELEFQIRRMNLGLEPPQPDQVVRLVEGVPGSAPIQPEQLVAGAAFKLERQDLR